MQMQKTVQIPTKVKNRSRNLLFRVTIKVNANELSIKWTLTFQLHQNPLLNYLCFALLIADARKKWEFRVTSINLSERKKNLLKIKIPSARKSPSITWLCSHWVNGEKPTVHHGSPAIVDQAEFLLPKGEINCADEPLCFGPELPLTFIPSSAAAQLHALNNLQTMPKVCWALHSFLCAFCWH